MREGGAGQQTPELRRIAVGDRGLKVLPDRRGLGELAPEPPGKVGSDLRLVGGGHDKDKGSRRLVPAVGLSGATRVASRPDRRASPPLLPR